MRTFFAARKPALFTVPATKLILIPLAVCATLAELSVSPTQAAVTEAWVQRYNGPGNYDDRPQAVKVDTSGNVVVTGYSYGSGTSFDYYTAKYAATNGALLWEQRYNSPSNRDDYAYAVAVDGSGNVVATGTSDNWTNVVFYTAKYAAANGAVLWEKRGPAGSAAAVAVDASGNVVVTGTSYDGDYYTAKYAAADGAVIWEKRYDGPGHYSDRAVAVAIDAIGNVVVTGLSNNGTNYDYYTAKYAAANGALFWENRYNGPPDFDSEFPALALDGGGNILMTKYSTNDYHIAKYSSGDGALLWEQRFNGFTNSYDEATAVAVDSSSNVVVTGIAGELPNFHSYTAKYAAADGALLWEKLGPSYSSSSGVVVDGSGNVVVSGLSYSGPNLDCYTAKYAAADGALLWEKRYNGPANGDDFVDGLHNLAIGPDGMVVIAGSSMGNAYDYATIAYHESLPAISITQIPAGVRVGLPGVAGHSYQVLRAPAVTGPWITNATLTAITNGILEHIDTNAPPGSAFYRTAQP